MTRVDVNSSECHWVMCRSGRSIWLEPREYDDCPTLPATSEVVAGYATLEDAEAAVAAEIASIDSDVEVP